MNLTKKEFKSKYSEYRKNLRSAHYKGLQFYSEVMQSDFFLREIKLNIQLPVSMKVWGHLNIKQI